MARFSPSLVLATLAACQGPASIPPPPEGATPQPPRANDCGPSVVFAHDDFYFADLERGRSCEVFVEQDECVLAVWSDCTEPRRRWEGELGLLPESMTWEVTLTTEHIEQPEGVRPSRCVGPVLDIDSPRRAARLRCETEGSEPHRGIFLERVDETPDQLGTVAETTMLPSALVSARRAGTGYLLALDGGLHQMVDAGSAPSPLTGFESVDHISHVSANGRFVVSAGPAIALATVTEPRMAEATLAAPPTAVGVGSAGVRAFASVSEEGMGSRIQGFTVDGGTLGPDPGGSKPVSGGRTDLIVGVDTDVVKVVTFSHRPDDGPIAGRESVTICLLDETLDERRCFSDLGFAVRQVVSTGARLAAAAEPRNFYLEISLSPPYELELIPVPYFENLRSVAFDPGQSRAFVAGLSPLTTTLTAIDTTTRRPIQTFSTVEGVEVVDLFFDVGAQRLLIFGEDRVVALADSL